jgi:hypothetical protein
MFSVTLTTYYQLKLRTKDPFMKSTMGDTMIFFSSDKVTPMKILGDDKVIGQH